jgi:zinc D-Ala-D-Ala carboxypeptidase
MKLSEHFHLVEFTFSQTAIRKAIPNIPSPEIIGNLKDVADGMEKVRTLLGNKPISITSGYRSAKLNQAVGGSKTSAHMLGYACDFICPSYGKPIAIVKKIKDSDIDFDQCIQEGTWVHISFDPKNRKQVLTALFDGNGGVRYSEGV